MLAKGAWQQKLGHEENEVQVARPNYTFCARDWWKLLENLYSDLRKSSMTCKNTIEQHSYQIELSSSSIDG